MMKPLAVLLAVGLLVGCVGTRLITSSGYLGIPDDRAHAYPDADTRLVPEVRDAYDSISEVQDVPHEEYVKARSAGVAVFIAECRGHIYYSVEGTACVQPEPGMRDHVQVLLRYRTRMSATTGGAGDLSERPP